MGKNGGIMEDKPFVISRKAQKFCNCLRLVGMGQLMTARILDFSI